MLGGMRDKACIVGLGQTKQGKLPGMSADEIAIWAFRLALDDSGLKKEQIDGLMVQESYGGGGDPVKVGREIGLNPKIGTSVIATGAAGAAMIQYATMVVAAGMANYVAVMYGTNQSTNRNRFATGNPDAQAPFGMFNPGAGAAMGFRRRMALYGTTERQLGTVTVTQRKHASMNPVAVLKDPLTIDDYLDSRYVIAPLRVYDFCHITDGGHCVIVTTPERARDLKQPPVMIMGMGRCDALQQWAMPDKAVMQKIQRETAEMVYEMAGIGRNDIDALYVQDAYTPAVLSAIENYGFCKEGEAGEFIQGGRIELGGELPVNLNGGQTSETYMIGWGHTADTIRQLRGVCGPRQVANAEIIQCTYSGNLSDHTASIIYRRP
jgi:acetyl-CoA acetyltransferase